MNKVIDWSKYDARILEMSQTKVPGRQNAAALGLPSSTYYDRLRFLLRGIRRSHGRLDGDLFRQGTDLHDPTSSERLRQMKAELPEDTRSLTGRICGDPLVPSRWTQAEKNQLLRLLPNFTGTQIAEQMGRTRGSVLGQLHRLGVKFPQRERVYKPARRSNGQFGGRGTLQEPVQARKPLRGRWVHKPPPTAPVGLARVLNGIPYLDALNSQTTCRWILSDYPKRFPVSELKCCGAWVDPNCPNRFCEHHYDIAFGRPVSAEAA